jgi:hypothetical protein
LLGAFHGAAFVRDVLFGAYVSPFPEPLADYPPWLVALGLTLLVALAIWVLSKVLKFALWLLFFAVLIGGTLWSLQLFLG